LIVVDASPLQTGHKYRGIGVYTGGLLDALTRLRLPEPLGLLAEPSRADDLPLLADLLARPGVEKITLPRPEWRRSRLQWVVGLGSVYPTILRARPRVYHATEGSGLVRVPGVATVATLYDLIPLHDEAAHFPLGRLDNRIGYARYLRLLQRADHLIAISEATKRDAVARLRIPPERISVTPLAVDERRFYPRSQEEIERALARYSLRRPYVLHIGSSDPNKNTSNILRAFDVFSRREHAEHVLCIAGKWPAQALAQLERSHAGLLSSGRLRMLGYVPDDDLPALYGGADLFVYPSLLEGFGLPILEAMRCGCPVLTSTVSSLPEVAGDAALLVDPRDSEAIADGLARVARDSELRAVLVRRGLRRADNFSWTRTAELTLRVYRSLL